MKFKLIHENFVILENEDKINLEKVRRIWSSILVRREYLRARLGVKILIPIGLLIILLSYMSNMRETPVPESQIDHIYQYSEYGRYNLKSSDGSINHVKLDESGKWVYEKNQGLFLLFMIIGIMFFIGAYYLYSIFIKDDNIYFKNNSHVIRLIGESFTKEINSGTFEETEIKYNEIKIAFEKVSAS